MYIYISIYKYKYKYVHIYIYIYARTSEIFRSHLKSISALSVPTSMCCKDVVVSGDSAGGNLALSLLFRLQVGEMTPDFIHK